MPRTILVIHGYRGREDAMRRVVNRLRDDGHNVLEVSPDADWTTPQADFVKRWIDHELRKDLPPASPPAPSHTFDTREGRCSCGVPGCDGTGVKTFHPLPDTPEMRELVGAAASMIRCEKPPAVCEPFVGTEPCGLCSGAPSPSSAKGGTT